MKGRKIRMRSNPKLAQSFQAGSTLTVILPTLHQTYGVINLEWPRYWPNHLNQWESAHRELVRLDSALLQIEVDSSHQRMVRDNALRDELYAVGTSLLANSVLSYQYLALEIENVARLPGGQGYELTERIRVALAAIDFSDGSAAPSWNALVELHKYRNAVAHPSPQNTYGTDDGSWRLVPLAWLASGRAIDASIAGLDLFQQVIGFWETKKHEFEGPGTVTLKRGTESLEQVKKPQTGAD